MVILTPTRFSLLLVFAIGLSSVRSEADDAQTEFDRVVQPFLKQHCDRCHGEMKHEAEFRLDTLSRDLASGPSGQKWAEVIERISSAQMPPDKEPQPTAEEGAKVVEWLAAKLKEGETTRLAQREKVTLHKLTREEYAYTIHDLLGVRFDPGGLAEAEAWHGLERIGSVLSLSPSHVEKYLAAAEAVLTETLPAKQPVAFSQRKDAIDLRCGSNRTRLIRQLNRATGSYRSEFDLPQRARMLTSPTPPANAGVSQSESLESHGDHWPTNAQKPGWYLCR